MCDLSWGSGGGLHGVSGDVSVLWQPMGCAILNASSPMSIGFVDSRNHMIRRLDVDAMQKNASIIAGNGRKALVDGNGSNASFWMPYAISTPPIDPAPYAIVADYGNRCIRRIELSTSASSGAVTTLVCDGMMTSPSDTAVLPNCNIYISDPISHTILLYNVSNKTVTRIAGMPGDSGMVDGAALGQAKFNQPLGICMHSFTGVLYIADWLNDAIRALNTSAGTVSTLFSGRGFRDGVFSMVQISGPKTVR